MIKKLYPLVIGLFLSSHANASCGSLELTKEFLIPYETDTQKWNVGNDPYFYGDPETGFRITLESKNIKIDFFARDAGVNVIPSDLWDQAVLENVYAMIQMMNRDEPMPMSDPRILPKELFDGSNKYLVHDAIFIVQKREPRNLVSVVSLGFDGRCYQKLRFTKELPQSTSDIATYFDNPFAYADVQVAIYTFGGIVRLLNDELYRVGHYR